MLYLVLWVKESVHVRRTFTKRLVLNVLNGAQNNNTIHINSSLSKMKESIFKFAAYAVEFTL